ncbi:MAG TPA: endonuclease/exonuclease/phosphatase family protein, partial [Gemmata sp.]
MRRSLLATLLALTGSAAPAADPGAPPVPVRVMSFNIRYGTARDGDNRWDLRKVFLAETVAAFDPDLLGTQETLADQRDFLAQKLKGYEGLAAGRDDGKEGGEMAALFYRAARFEKLGGGHFWFSDTPDTPGSKGWDAALPRVATWVKLKDRTAPDGRPVLFLNAHLDHRGKTARVRSAELIRAKVAELGKGCRVVVTGDFNAGEGSGPYTALFGPADQKPSPLVDTFRAQHPARGKNEGTFCDFKAAGTDGDRIDWIGCSRDWDVRLAGIDRTSRDGRTPSDHFPVTAVLRPREPGQQPTVRVLCYNVHHGEGTDGKRDLARIARVIRAADPDLVALQELDDRTKRTGGVDQTAELARLTGLHAAFGKAIDFQGGGYGQAVLSRFPLGGTTVHPLPGGPNREKRIALEARLKVDGRDLSFVTTHLDHQLAGDREQQAAKLNELFAGADRPVLLVGDLNATRDSKAFAALAAKWADATAGKGLLTIPADRPKEQIDHVLFRPADRFRVRGAAVPDEPVASDHRPVLVVLEPAPAGKP